MPLDRKNSDPKQVVWFHRYREPSVGGCTLDDETIGLAAWPVIVWKYGLKGCILWDCTPPGPSKNLWGTRTTAGREQGGGAQHGGFVICPSYHGKPGIAEPVASVRLKSLRRGAQDYEHLPLLEAAGRSGARDCLHKPNRP